MKVWQLVKKLNNTELGKGGTHDTYVLIPNNLDISDIIGTINEQCDFVDKSTGQHVKIRKTVYKSYDYMLSYLYYIKILRYVIIFII